MRFGQVAGWDNKDAPFIFSFEILRQDNGKVIIKKGEWRNARMKGLSSIFTRIKGI